MNATVEAVPTFRAAEAADVPRIVALVESAYRGDVSRRGWTTEADFLDGQRTDPVGVAQIIGTPGNRILLAERDGELLACCQLEHQGDACYFGMFAVAPSLQGGGVGKQMMTQAERIAAQEWKCTQMQMTVITIRHELIAWYERRGYRRSGVFKPFPYGDARFGIPKREDLQFEVLVKNLGS
jgi:ribosomal protein S18 acetylase RimI-like enzyme